MTDSYRNVPVPRFDLVYEEDEDAFAPEEVDLKLHEENDIDDRAADLSKAAQGWDTVYI